MEFDFASGLTSTEEEVIIDPEEIFRRQASGKNLWIGQGDILRDWYNNRNKNDVLISMDTGMGKTIVGLLIAYSIMNEKKRKVVYLCASKQLVEQTVNEARELGIKTASYLSGNYTNEFEFYECKVPLIITPSFQKGGKWKELDEDNILVAKTENIIDKIIEFKESDSKKLLLANRYDGIDFPGKSCRVLVFDGLPSEGELLNSYFSIQLKANNYIRSEMNAKILQGIGRIFRGTDDFGIVILLGKDEIKWVSTPKNKIEFPQLMQVQLSVGNKLNEMITEENFSDLISQILTKNTTLMGAYDRFIDDETKKIERMEDTSEDEKN